MFSRASAFNSSVSASSSSGHVEAVLAGTQVPRQPFVVIVDGSSRSSVPVLKEMIARDVESSRRVVLITALHRAEDLLPQSVSTGAVSVLDLSERLGEYGDSIGLAEVRDWIVRELATPSQVYIDSLPHLSALSTSSPSSSANFTALRLIRDVLCRLSSAPSRLTLLLPHTSPLLRDLSRASFSSTLTCLRLHPPAILDRHAEEHLVKPPETGDLATPGNRSWSLMQRAEESWVDVMAEGSSDWAVGTMGAGALVELTVRKAHGGSSKGMTRSLEGLVVGHRRRLFGRRWQELPDLGASVAAASSPTPNEGGSHQVAGASSREDNASTTASQQHPSQADTSFNLGLTAEQLASRATVPIPYAYDGTSGGAGVTSSGGGGMPVILFEPGSEDDVDEDDPDEDLDF